MQKICSFCFLFLLYTLYKFLLYTYYCEWTYYCKSTHFNHARATIYNLTVCLSPPMSRQLAQLTTLLAQPWLLNPARLNVRQSTKATRINFSCLLHTHWNKLGFFYWNNNNRYIVTLHHLKLMLTWTRSAALQVAALTWKEKQQCLRPEHLVRELLLLEQGDWETLSSSTQVSFSPDVALTHFAGLTPYVRFTSPPC